MLDELDAKADIDLLDGLAVKTLTKLLDITMKLFDSLRVNWGLLTLVGTLSLVVTLLDFVVVTLLLIYGVVLSNILVGTWNSIIWVGPVIALLIAVLMALEATVDNKREVGVKRTGC